MPNPPGRRRIRVKRDGAQAEFLAALPDKRPIVAAGDALAMPIGLCCAVDSVPAGITSLPP